MISKPVKLIGAMALLQCFSAWGKQSSELFEQVCHNNGQTTYISVEVGQPTTFIPNAGSFNLLQNQNEQLDVNRLIELFVSRFEIARECAEYLVINGNLVQRDEGDVLATVYFDFDKAQLTPVSTQILDRIIQVAKQSEKEFNLTGHTDSTGTAKYNFALGIKRAENVQQYLSDSGKLNVAVESQGETNPIATNETAEGRAQNRRVEITL